MTKLTVEVNMDEDRKGAMMLAHSLDLYCAVWEIQEMVLDSINRDVSAEVTLKSILNKTSETLGLVE